MTGPLYHLGRFCSRRLWWVIGAWLVFVIALVAVSHSVGEKTNDNLNLPGTGSTQSTDLLQQRLKNAGCAVRMVPAQVLGVKLGPVFLENPETRFELPPHFRLRMRRDDGYLRGIEFQRC